VSDEKLWDESPTSRHLQVLYHQTSFHRLELKLAELRKPEIELELELHLLKSNQL